MDTISVVIPTYNGEATLRETVESVLAQTYGELEVIVVDDGSTDGTEGTVKDYAEQGRITYIKRENGGIAASRNTGLRACTGEYIALIDHDDLWDRDKLERQIGFLNESDADFVFCHLRRVGLDGKVSQFPAEPQQHQEVLDGLLVTNIIYTSSVLFKRSILDNAGFLDEDFRYCEDWDWWLRIASCSRMKCMPEYLVTRKDQPTSFSITYTGRYIHYAKLYRKHAGLLGGSRRKAFRKNMANKCYTDAVKLLKAEHRDEAFAAFREAVWMRHGLLFRLPKFLRANLARTHQ